MISGQTQYGDYWQGSGAPYGKQVCLDIPGIGFRSYPNIDTAVNRLYVSGHKELARIINKEFKQSTSNA